MKILIQHRKQVPDWPGRCEDHGVAGFLQFFECFIDSGGYGDSFKADSPVEVEDEVHSDAPPFGYHDIIIVPIFIINGNIYILNWGGGSHVEKVSGARFNRDSDFDIYRLAVSRGKTNRPFVGVDYVDWLFWCRPCFLVQFERALEKGIRNDLDCASACLFDGCIDVYICFAGRRILIVTEDHSEKTAWFNHYIRLGNDVFLLF